MNSGKSGTLEIQTPEGVTFSLVLAGPVSRFLAWAVDLFCIGVAVATFAELMQVLRFISPDVAAASNVLTYFVVSVGYGMACEWFWRGQTVGKRLMRLRVMDAQGLRLQPQQVIIRNLLRFVDMLPAFYLLGGIVLLLNRRTQRLGDLAANTIVVRTPEERQPDLDQLLGGKFNSLLDHPHLAARLRQQVPASIAGLALDALLRRDQFDPPARLQLFRELAMHFRSLVEFPPESVEQLGDEQYVRNVVGVLFKARSSG